MESHQNHGASQRATPMNSAKHAGTHQAIKQESSGHSHYGRFLVMILLSFIAMFVFMYAMVDRIGNAVPNVNQAYMAALMTAPMLILELLLMGTMYPDKRKNLLLLGGGVLLLLGSWFAIREQFAVGDQQFLKSMIPHHAGAILMCNEADLTRADVKQLCAEIVQAQEREIAQMREMLSKGDG